MCNNNTINSKVLGKRLNQSQGKNPKAKIGITTTICKCNYCGLIYSNPQPIPNNIQDHYGVPPENYWVEEYFSINSDYFKGELQRLQELSPFLSGQKALDIGAGLGKCMIALQNHGYDTFGFEPSESFYDRAINKMGIAKDRLQLASIEDIDFPVAGFDFITFGAVLEHLYDPDACLKKAFSWLKPNGIIHIEVPSSDWIISKIFNFYYFMIGTDYVTNLSPMHSPFHLYEFSLKSFEDNGLINGYKIIKSEYYECDTFMPKILDKPLKWYMKKNNKGMQLAIWLQKI